MSSPEIHVHVHLHGVTTSFPAEEDAILTQRTYSSKPKHPANAGQLDLSGLPDPSPEEPEIIEEPVAITPQTTHDQRVEVADYSARNRHLVKVDEQISLAHSKRAAVERTKLGFLEGYDEAGLQRNAEKASNRASEELTLACGNCALTCAIRDNFTKWGRVHEYASTPKTTGQEARNTWRRRLVKNPEAHCLPGKSKKDGTQKAA